MKNTLQLEDVFDELNHPFRRLNFISFYEKNGLSCNILDSNIL